MKKWYYMRLAFKDGTYLLAKDRGFWERKCWEDCYQIEMLTPLTYYLLKIKCKLGIDKNTIVWYNKFNKRKGNKRNEKIFWN